MLMMTIITIMIITNTITFYGPKQHTAMALSVCHCVVPSR